MYHLANVSWIKTFSDSNVQKVSGDVTKLQPSSRILTDKLWDVKSLLLEETVKAVKQVRILSMVLITLTEYKNQNYPEQKENIDIKLLIFMHLLNIKNTAGDKDTVDSG